MRRFFVIFAFLISVAMAASATNAGFGSVRAMAATDEITINEEIVIEGIIVGDCNSANMEQNTQTSHASVSTSINNQTTYIESLDGQYGFRLIFMHERYNQLQRYSRVKLSLAGTILRKQMEPERYTIADITPSNIIEVVRGNVEQSPVKNRRIAELTDEDIYTFVTLTDVCFTFRNGCYTNIWESYAQESVINADLKPNGRMDGWAVLAGDAADCSKAIYIPINTKCDWRRNAVPQGRGTISGIVVHPSMRRYGNAMGRYAVRPIDENDICISDKRKDYPYRTMAEWVYDDNPAAELCFESMGLVGGVKSAKYMGDAVLAERGQGRLWCDAAAYVMLTGDYNNLSVASKGWLGNAALRFDAPASAWYEFDDNGVVVGAKSFFVEFSTAKIKASQLLFAFRFGAGLQSAETSYDFPAHWAVEYSVDGGRSFARTHDCATGREVVVMRALPWWDKVVGELGYIRAKTSYDASLGYTAHSFALPSDCLGKKSVIVRLTPADDTVAEISANPKAATDVHRKASVGNMHTTTIRFGEIAVMYR